MCVSVGSGSVCGGGENESRWSECRQGIRLSPALVAVSGPRVFVWLPFWLGHGYMRGAEA